MEFPKSVIVYKYYKFLILNTLLIYKLFMNVQHYKIHFLNFSIQKIFIFNLLGYYLIMY